MTKKSYWPIVRGVISAILIFILLQLIGGFAAIGLDKLPIKLPSILIGLMSIYIAEIAVVFMFLHEKGDGKHFIKKYAERLKFHKINNFPLILLETVSLIALVIGINLLLFFIVGGKNTGNATTTSLTNKSLGLWIPLVSYIMPVIIAPFFEETIFRGILGNQFDVFNGKTSNKVAYLITESLFFGLMHLQLTGSTLAMITAVTGPAVSGLFFGIVYLKTKNISNNIAIHGTYNLFTVLMTMLVS